MKLSLMLMASSFVVSIATGCGTSSATRDAAPNLVDGLPRSVDAVPLPGPDAAFADACVATCGPAVCGDDGCGGSCGTCSGDDYCGGGGQAGQCGSGAIAAYPGVTPIEIDTGAVLGLRVANDERHVMLQRTESADLNGGELAVVTIDGAGHGTATTLTTKVEFRNGIPQADFTDDSSALYFIDIANTSKLTVAAADGSNLHVVATGGIQAMAALGDILVYVVAAQNDFDDEMFAMSLPDGQPVPLATGFVPQIYGSATGRAVFAVDDTGSALHELVQTDTGVATPLASSGDVVSGVWSPDGAHLAYWFGFGENAVTIRLIDADGSNDTLLTSTSPGGFPPVFSPDGTVVAYSLSTGANSYEVIFRTIATGSNVIATVPTGSYPSPPTSFSPDGGVFAMLGAGPSFALASTTQNGAFVDTATLPLFGFGATICQFTTDGDFAATPSDSRTLLVVPTHGGAVVTPNVPIDEPGFYEPVASQPGLLAFSSTNPTEDGIAGSVELIDTDGSGTAMALPGTVLPASTNVQEYHLLYSGWQGTDDGLGQENSPFTWGWLGSEIVYQTDRDGTLPWFDLVAATDTIGTVGVIAPGTNLWAVRTGSAPTRVVFGRNSVGGTWWSPLPQTPGR